MTARSRPRGVLHVAMVSAAALAFMTTGCDASTSSAPAAMSDEDEVVSCGFMDKKPDGTEEWVVLPEDHCDDDGDGHGGGGYFAVISSSHSDHNRNAYTTPGSRLPRAAVPLKGAPIRYNDAGARSAAGLPPAGKVASGPRATFNSGLGKGGNSNTGGTGGKSGGSSGSGGKSGGTGGSGGS